jgi:hypothetical protein
MRPDPKRKSLLPQQSPAIRPPKGPHPDLGFGIWDFYKRPVFPVPFPGKPRSA